MNTPARILVAALTACGALSLVDLTFVGDLAYVGAQQAPATRRIVRTAADRLPSLPAAAASTGNWPSFRGLEASGVADGQNLPDTWNVQTGSNVLWRTSIPGLSHSSPIVWGNRLFVTTAVSSNPNATFRPGLYGDGDASEDRSRQRW